MKRVGAVLTGLSFAVIIVLLLWPIYIEPGNGSIGCGRVWDAEPTEDFLAEECDSAVDDRRMQLLAALVVGGCSATLFVAARRSKSDDA